MNDYITIGIPTSGAPEFEKQGDHTLLRNMLIGKDFHWQQSIEALLPGEVSVLPGEEYPVINRLPTEDYLKCVVGSEMNPGAPVEFLKAHAVISRSWATGKITGCHDHSATGKTDIPGRIICWEDTCDHRGFDVCSDDHCQRYQGVQPLSDNVRKALEATEGEVLLTPEGRLVDARFSKCCGGRTEVFSSCWQPREEACLESFDDPWCNLESLSAQQREKILSAILKDYDRENQGGYRWTTEVTAEEIRRNLNVKFGRDVGSVSDLEILKRGKSGRAVTILVTGTGGRIEIGKELMVRRLLAPTHLYSSRIELKRDKIRPGLWHIEGAGWGHGVGLCQIGAARMAMEGYSYREILEFYYPGAIVGHFG